mgnify:CR=1 FL=1
MTSFLLRVAGYNRRSIQKFYNLLKNKVKGVVEIIDNFPNNTIYTQEMTWHDLAYFTSITGKMSDICKNSSEYITINEACSITNCGVEIYTLDRDNACEEHIVINDDGKVLIQESRNIKIWYWDRQKYKSFEMFIKDNPNCPYTEDDFKSMITPEIIEDSYDFKWKFTCKEMLTYTDLTGKLYSIMCSQCPREVYCHEEGEQCDEFMDELAKYGDEDYIYDEEEDDEC